MPLIFSRILRNFTNLWNNMNSGQRFSLVLLSALLIGILGWTLTNITSYDNMERLIGPEEPYEIRAQVIDYLKEAGLHYEVRADETIYVPKGTKPEIVLELSGAGLLTDKAVYDFLDKAQITTTKLQFDMQVIVATQRRIESMIRNIKFVKNAKVQITRADDRTSLGFVGESAKASVLLELMPGKKLGKEHVLGIANIISAAVPHMNPADVKIVDTAGRLYRTLPEEGGPAIASNVRELEESYEARIEGKVRNILVPIFHDVYASARVKLSSKTINEKLNEVRPGEVVNEEKRDKVDKSKFGNQPVGVTKEATELPAPEAGIGYDITEKEKKSELAPSRYQKETQIPPGTIEAVSIAVVIPVRDEENKQDIGAIRELVKNAIGPDAKDEDISVSFMPMPSPQQLPEVSTSSVIMTYVEKYAPPLFMGIFSLIVLFMLYKVINNALSKTKIIDTDHVQEILQKELEQVSKIPTEPEVEKITEDISTLVKRNPKISAGILKQWIFES